MVGCPFTGLGTLVRVLVWIALKRALNGLLGCALQGVVEQDREYHADGHTGQGFQDEFDNGFGVHGMEIMETFALGFRLWIAAST
jgi:hypothetical protein